jgi:hypothetical protein
MITIKITYKMTCFSPIGAPSILTIRTGSFRVKLIANEARIVNLYKNLRSKLLNKPVFIVRPDDGPIGPKHVALYVLLMVIIDVLDKNINTLFNHRAHRDK